MASILMKSDYWRNFFVYILSHSDRQIVVYLSARYRVTVVLRGMDALMVYTSVTAAASPFKGVPSEWRGKYPLAKPAQITNQPFQMQMFVVGIPSSTDNENKQSKTLLYWCLSHVLQQSFLSVM